MRLLANPVKAVVRSLSIAAVMGAAFAAPALAEYPERPVTIVAPYGAGGSSDTLARILGERMGALLGSNFIVENRPGAGSRVGTEYVARAKGDGYTILLADMPFAIVPNLYKDAAYKTDDFVAIGQVGVAPMVLFARPDLKDATIDNIIKDARAKDEALTIGSGGVGATTHMVAELFQRAVKAKLLHVPFGGSGPSLQGLAGSQIDVAFSTFASGSSLFDAGSIQAVGVTSRERMAAAPNIPTFTEKGYDLVVEHWWGMVAPASVPADIVAKLRSAMTAAMKEDVVKERLAKLKVTPSTLSPDQFQAFLASENERWGGIIKSAGIKISQ